MKSEITLLLILFLLPMSIVFSNAESISIDLDRESYKKGDIVTLHGSSSGSNYYVAIEIQDSQGNTILIRNVQSDFDGNFELKFKISDDVEYGVLHIYANADIEGEKVSTSTQTMVSEINSISPSNTSSSGGCLIATATFGSELAPQVQALRELRDNTLLHTESGSAFMSVFNSIYYSFSPTISDWERQSPVFKEIVKTAITPMIASLSLLNIVDIDSESEMLGFGIGIIVLNGLMYFGAPVFTAYSIKKRFF